MILPLPTVKTWLSLDAKIAENYPDRFVTGVFKRDGDGYPIVIGQTEDIWLGAVVAAGDCRLEIRPDGVVLVAG
jgi:hypothetical protein